MINLEGLRAGCLWIVTHPITTVFGIIYTIYTLVKIGFENWRNSRRLILKQNRRDESRQK